MKLKKRLKCLDGHYADSYLERFVDNLLHRYGVKHIIHPKLPGTRMYGDFLLIDSGVYIEIWGDIKLGDYKKRKKEKIEYYEQKRLKLVEIQSLTDACFRLKKFLRRGMGIEEWTKAEEGVRKESGMMEEILNINEKIEELNLRREELINQYNRLIVEEVKKFKQSD